jgi:hypothetical protein
MRNFATGYRAYWPNSLRVAAILIFCLGCTHSLWGQWTKAGLSGNAIYGMDSNGASMFIGTTGNGIYKGSGNDSNWVAANVGLTTVRDLCIKNYWGFLYAGTDSGVFLSNDSAKTWTAKNTGLTTKYVRAIEVNGTWIYAGTEGGGAFKSFDNGGTWNQLSISPSASTIRTLLYNQKLFAGTFGGGVFSSTDGGANWSPHGTGLTDLTVRALAVVGTNLFAGTPSGVFVSAISGGSWTQVNTGLTNTSVETFAVSGTTLYAGCSYNWTTSTPGGVFKTTDNGTQWTAFNTGLTLGNNDVRTLFCTSTTIYAGTGGSGLFTAPITATSVEEESSIAKSFTLSQNYPNPFNPTTVISYQLPVTSNVALRVFDIIGREVATLVNETKEAGSYEVTFNASKLASGMYFYRLQAGNFSAIKKLVLIK